jgi:uncharacterized BrkB/YihY/UPF0761 family membrane protein
MTVLMLIIVVAIAATLAMGIWLVSVPLVLVLLGLMGAVLLKRHTTDAAQIEELREQIPNTDPPPGEDGRDHSTLYEHH